MAWTIVHSCRAVVVGFYLLCVLSHRRTDHHSGPPCQPGQPCGGQSTLELASAGHVVETHVREHSNSTFEARAMLELSGSGNVLVATDVHKLANSTAASATSLLSSGEVEDNIEGQQSKDQDTKPSTTESHSTDTRLVDNEVAAPETEQVQPPERADKKAEPSPAAPVWMLSIGALVVVLFCWLLTCIWQCCTAAGGMMCTSERKPRLRHKVLTSDAGPYEWEQTSFCISFYVKVPPGIIRKNVEVTIMPRFVVIEEGKETLFKALPYKETFFKAQLHSFVDATSSHWNLQGGDSGDDEVAVHLAKEDDEHWPCLFSGEQESD